MIIRNYFHSATDFTWSESRLCSYRRKGASFDRMLHTCNRTSKTFSMFPNAHSSHSGCTVAHSSPQSYLQAAHFEWCARTPMSFWSICGWGRREMIKTKFANKIHTKLPDNTWIAWMIEQSQFWIQSSANWYCLRWIVAFMLQQIENLVRIELQQLQIT